jgi:CRISPR/Cas system CSM-associated protein Csm3 (group 7 of RAMP superfamily)
LFGSLNWKGRFLTGDAYLTEEHRDKEPEVRDGIGVDRISGGVAGSAKFDQEVMPAGVVFTTRVEVVNFEAWQLGWLAYLMRDLMDGYLRLGMGTSRGLGRVSAGIDRLRVQYVGTPDVLEEDGVPGIGVLVGEDERRRYGLEDDDTADRPDGLDFERPSGALRSEINLTDTSAQRDLLAAVAPAWDDYIAHADPITA